MAEVPSSLGDFFAKNKKKKVKAVNLNNESTKPTAEELKAAKAAKEKEDPDWKDEEQVAVPQMKVEMAGKLMREDDKKDEDDHVAPAWRMKNTSASAVGVDSKKFPTLKKSVGLSSNINIDDGSSHQVNIKTSKNKFDALGDDDDDEDGPKRPKEIKPYLAAKQKGEMVSAVIQREVNKYGGESKKPAAADKPKKAKKVKEVASDEDSSEDEAETKRKQQAAKKAAKASKELGDDCKIEPDLQASRVKYQGREKLPTKQLPRAELEEEKENKPVNTNTAGGKKSKKKGIADDDDEVKPKLMVAPDDW